MTFLSANPAVTISRVALAIVAVVFTILVVVMTRAGSIAAPLISAVTMAGWAWRPTAWHGPRWLRWLTQ